MKIKKMSENMNKKLKFFRHLFSILLFAFFGTTVTPSFVRAEDDSEFCNLFHELDLIDKIGNGEDGVEMSIDELMVDINDDVINDELTRSAVDGISLWGRTAGSRGRNPLYSYPNRVSSFDRDGFYSNLFFNRSHRIDVAPALLLSDQATNLIHEFLGNGDDIESEDFGTMIKLLPYVLDMTAQEHRFGSYLQYVHSFDPFVFQLEVPFFVIEKNYWLEGKKKRADLQKLIDELDGLEGGALYKIKAGLGDTKLKFGYKAIDADRCKLNVGFSSTIPTSGIRAAKKPSFERGVNYGDDRQKLINGLLKVGRQIMIEPKLGQGAWGLGTFLDANVSFFKDKLDVWGRLSWDYLFNVSDYRFLPTITNVSLADLFSITQADGIPSDFPLDDIFPHMVKMRINPGMIYNATIGTKYHITNNWKIGVGYDLYIQHAEKVKNIRAYDIENSLLRVDNALAGRVIQHKIFGDISYEKKGKHVDWLVSLGADKTIATSRASKDWTICAKLGFRF